MGGTTGWTDGGCTDGGASLALVETPVSFTGVEAVVVVVGCFCATSSTTFDLLGLVNFFVASAFLLGAILIVATEKTKKKKRE